MKNTPTTITQNNKEMGNELVKNRFLIRCLSIFFLKSFLKMIRMIKIGNNATTSQNFVINPKEQSEAEKSRILRLIFPSAIALINNKKGKNEKEMSKYF